MSLAGSSAYEELILRCQRLVLTTENSKYVNGIANHDDLDLTKIDTDITFFETTLMTYES